MIYVGVDIAKRSHVLSAADDGGGVAIDSLKFPNTASGFGKLVSRLRKAGAGPGSCLVGMEATGRYWIALFDFLTSHSYDAVVINPIQMDAFRNVWTVRKVKTDAVDAAMIADLVRYKRYEPSALGDDATDELRNLSRYRKSLVDRSTMIKNRATAILDRALPELDGLFAGSYGPAERNLLALCATPEQVLSADVRTIARILKEASGGLCGQEKADQLKEAARNSVGVGFGAKTLAFEMRLLMEELGFVQEQISQVERELVRLLDKTCGRWLLTIPGIGVVLASAIAGEIGDPHRFENPHQFMAFAGMDPSKKASGEAEDAEGSMSKRDTGILRWAFMVAAECVRRYDPYFGDYYAKKKGPDKKHHYVALSGVARKLMGVCLALMKEERPYEAAPPMGRQPGHLGGACL